MLDKRLNDKGKNWRHVLKSLKVLDYCLHEGSELVVTWARKNIYIIKTLREFQYIDEDGRDVGQNGTLTFLFGAMVLMANASAFTVRFSAKELTSLILDEERLRAERSDRKSWKSRVTGLEDSGYLSGYAGGSEPQRPRQKQPRPKRDDEDDLEYRLAIEASKNEAEEDAKRRAMKANSDLDDDDLAKAIRLSKEEEELRRRELEETNAASLFDDTPAQQPQPTGWNQGYQQQGQVDWFGNLLDQQQPQNTGFAGMQSTGLQGQQTGYQDGFGYAGYQQPQQTGFDQMFGQQPQQSYIQPQQTAFNMNNPYGQQMNGFDAFGQQPLQQQSTVQPGSHNPWATGSQQTQDSITAQPTGSNNPFASSFGRTQTAPAQRVPTLSTLQEQKAQSQFNRTSSFTPQQTVQPAKQPEDPHRAQLNALLASGEGQDTFGNVGNLRIPAQHTAPGTFVNSAGAGASRLTANATGTNPFLQTQFTGMPQTTGFGQQNRVMPAQTGPAGGFGGNNPFSQQQGGQQQQQQQSGSLIDL